MHAYFEQGLCVNLMIDRNIIDAKDSRFNDKLGEIKNNADFYARRFQEDMRDF
ncbi:MAG: hypothetical protein HC913_19140 [Microscillaceae bacterium]|nr:hypothetical protein [Microscillaceae bacterium]